MADDRTSLPCALRKRLPRPLIRFLGFAFLQCWVLAVFSSFIPYGDNPARLPVGWLHCLSSLASILTACAVLLLTIRLVPMSRRKELGLLMAVAGSTGTLFVHLASKAAMPAWCGMVGLILVAVCATWLHLSWQEYFSTQGAQAAVLGFALATIVGMLLFFALGWFPRAVGVGVAVALPLAADLSLRPHRGARFYLRDETPSVKSTRDLCADIAHDWSPRLMTVVSLVALAYGTMRASSVPSQSLSSVEFWLRFGGGLAAGSVVACLAVWSVQRGSVMRAFYVAIPLSALGVIVRALPFSGVPEASAFLGTCGFLLVNYLVWIVMLERAYSRKLPVLGLLASLWTASYTGVLGGQLVALAWPVGAEFLNYLALSALLAASLLLVSMNGKLTVSQTVLEASEATSAAQRALEIAAEAKLSPRETEILAIWLTGHNAAYIEDTLHISRNTVKTHLKHIYQKTGVESKEELLRK
ncbi:hypothetical protein B5F40_06515 [Gordonibacter sp. An230]|uniref:helix-turn-helix transcriptional regulator n=1 Tax=Gordonibacter sp. An230 TaxID=1965592 RepID=UPI000B3879EC|nr:helix-turn-helix transcriptional regulator [Gordonibacter sp. An230]OUO90605.1 hypothetical protein B5F40_06515 [Gordonibacter sp. An230]